MLFWVAVFGNLMLAVIAIQRMRASIGALRHRAAIEYLSILMPPVFFLGLALLLPVGLFVDNQAIANAGVVIGLAVPVIYLLTRITALPMRIVDLAVIALLTAFALTGESEWLWGLAILLAVIWMAARRAIPKKPRLLKRDEEFERLHDPFGSESWPPSANLSDPHDPLWRDHYYS